MKINLFCCFVLTSSILSFSYAQQMSNSSFEQWFSNGSYEDPLNWSSSNNMFLDVFKSTDAHSGNYSAMLEKFYIDINGDGSADPVPCQLQVGDVNSQVLPFNSRPDSIVGWFKFINGNGSNSTNTWGVNLTLNYSNGAMIAENHEFSQMQFLDWTRFSYPINYSSSDIPEFFTLNFVLNGVVGTKLYLDDLKFEYNTDAGMDNVGQDGFKLFTFKKVLIVESKSLNHIIIYNSLGIELAQFNISEKSSVFSLEDFPAGIYIVKNDTGYSKKISLY